MESFNEEIIEKKRFQFGKNWTNFLRNIDEERIENSKASLLKFLGLKTFRIKKKSRGMSVFADLIDWVGGYPFEFSMPEDFFLFFKSKGYVLENLKTNKGGPGCNKYLFKKI